MTTSILVTGGTGTLGRAVAQRLRDAGASVTVLSRHPAETAEAIRYTAGDLSTGAGIEAAVRGAEIIVHCAGSSKGDEQKTRTLVSAATGARYIVLISVVGADRIPQASAIDRAVVRLLRHEARHRAGHRAVRLTSGWAVRAGGGWSSVRTLGSRSVPPGCRAAAAEGREGCWGGGARWAGFRRLTAAVAR